MSSHDLLIYKWKKGEIAKIGDCERNLKTGMQMLLQNVYIYLKH